MRRNDGSIRGTVQVDARLRGNHVDRAPLFLQLGQWTTPGEARWSNQKARRPGAHASSALLVPMGRRLYMDHRRSLRNDDGCQRVVPHLARTAEDHPGCERWRRTGRSYREVGRLTIAAQYLHVGTARVGDDWAAYDILRRRQSRNTQRLLLGVL